jgi:anti-sigma-K factor RskA
MDEREHEQLRDDISVWAIGALEPAEAAALEEHIRGCESCARQARWLMPATSALLESVEQLEPAPDLRERVMSEIRADAARREGSQGRERRSFWDFLLRPATAMAAVAILVVSIGGYVLSSGGDDREAPPTLAECEDPGGLICATLERQGDTGTLQVSGLRQLEEEQVYQAWVQHGDVMKDSSLFAPRGDGTATAAIPRDDLHGGDAVLVTIEPRGGSTKPTSDPLVSVDID